MRIRVAYCLVVGLIAALGNHGALAAPQILAVLATNGGVPFACADGLCQADISTFCLQRDRPAPEVGTAYLPAEPSVFTLVAIDANGNERRLPAAGYVTFIESRGFTAISARLGEDVLVGLGAVGARLELGANASLVPVPRQGDPDPLTAGEIAYVTGPLRNLGALVVDGSPDADSARVVATMVGLLPREGRLDAERLAALWGEATGDDGLAAADSPGPLGARAAYEGCIDAIEEQRIFSIRGCLERSHDRLMRGLSVEYWNAIPLS